MTLRRRIAAYVTIALLIGVLDGVSLTSLAAARRTQSSYPAFLRHTNPADVTFSTYGISGASSANLYSPELTAQIRQLPQVKHLQSWVGMFILPLTKAGGPDMSNVSAFNIAGSVDGLYFDV